MKQVDRALREPCLNKNAKSTRIDLFFQILQLHVEFLILTRLQVVVVPVSVGVGVARDDGWSWGDVVGVGVVRGSRVDVRESGSSQKDVLFLPAGFCGEDASHGQGEEELLKIKNY